MAGSPRFGFRYLFGTPLSLAVALYAAVLVASAVIAPPVGALREIAGGTADEVGPSRGYVMAFACVGLLLLLIFLVVIMLVRRGPITLLDVPHSDYWRAPGREDQLRELIAQDIKNVFVGVFLLVTLILGSTTGSALDSTDQLVSYVPLAVGVFVLFLFGYAVYVKVHRYKPRATV